jgi:hypothetical protein
MKQWWNDDMLGKLKEHFSTASPIMNLTRRHPAPEPATETSVFSSGCGIYDTELKDHPATSL